ncbi:MAG TPA: universal stress protein, partial [Acidimicrobiales bacterium]|nr:universal stress protein [Acidimicrobiales bacterium]
MSEGGQDRRGAVGDGGAGATGPRLVVGVDGTPAAAAALRWAVAEARLRGAVLHVVHAWPYPVEMAVSSAGGVVPPLGDMRRWAEEVIDEAVADAVGPDLTVVRDAWSETPAVALVEASAGAALLVVGTRGHRRLTGLFLGSVSQYVAVHAHCPVVVVHAPDPAGAPRAEAAEGEAAEGAGRPARPGLLEEIPEEECLALLAGQEIGRLAVVEEGAPVVLPVNYVLDGRTVAVRTGPGTKLSWGALGPVALEVDVVDAGRATGWSVLVQGVGRDITEGLDSWSERLRSRPLVP